MLLLGFLFLVCFCFFCLVFCFFQEWLPVIGDKERHLERRSCNVHVQFNLLFEQLLVLGSIRSGVRRNETQTRRSMTCHPNSFIGGRSVVATRYYLSERLPNGRLMCMWRATNSRVVHSTGNNNFFNAARVQLR